MKQVTIIEVDYHPEVLYNTCRLLAVTDLKVVVFTKGWIYRQIISDELSGSQFQWFVEETSSAIRKTIRSRLELINSSDIVLFNTLASHFRFFTRLGITAPTLLRIHNVNAYLRPGRSFRPVFTPHYLFKDTSHIVRKTIGQSDWYWRARFLQKVDSIVFPDEFIEQKVKEQRLWPEERIAPFLPITFRDPLLKKSEAGEIVRITIPGTIDNRRRDYRLVMEAIRKVAGKLEKEVELILLGRPKGSYGRKIAAGFMRLQTDRLRITTFDGKIPMEKFRQYLRETDFFILPVVIPTRYTIYREYYGYTKISGSINDMIVAGKPSLINRDYPLNRHLREICTTFDTPESLAGHLLDWVNQGAYLGKAKKVDESLAFYDRERLAAYTVEVFKSLQKSNHDGHH
ncbi:MAG: hypothetical protein Kow00127_17340 [Bacteroidales bacterium]